MVNCPGGLKTEKESILFSFPEIPGCFFNLRRIFFLLLQITKMDISSFYCQNFVYIEDFPEDSNIRVVKHDLNLLKIWQLITAFGWSGLLVTDLTLLCCAIVDKMCKL